MEEEDTVEEIDQVVEEKEDVNNLNGKKFILRFVIETS